MGETGILADDPRIELIAGQIVVREPIGAEPRAIRLARLRAPARRHAVRRHQDFDTRAHPIATDVLLLIEVADASVRLDRRVRIPRYARAGVGATFEDLLG